VRLSVVESGHDPHEAAVLDMLRAASKREPVDVVKTLHYRPEIFGEPFCNALDVAMRAESDWSPAERELFAAYVSSLNQCPF
jgi:hypothetical protein